MTLVLNFMSPHEAISVWTVTSILGYSLLPVNLLAALKLVVVNLGNLQLLGQCLGILTVVWCTVASTRLMEQGCGMRDQRYLIAYPIGLLYTAFVMITIFRSSKERVVVFMHTIRKFIAAYELKWRLNIGSLLLVGHAVQC